MIYMGSLLLMMGIAACSSNTNTATEQEPSAENATLSLSKEQQEMAGIVIGKASRNALEQTVQCNGQVGIPPYSLASVYTPVAAFVKDVRLLEGEPVKKGQTLVVLQHPEIIKMQQEYLTNLNKLNFLRSDFERKQQLIAEDATSTKTFELTKADYEAMKATVEGTSLQLQMMGIDVASLDKGGIQSTIALRAPIDGYLSQVLVNKGKYVAADEMLFEIVDNSHLHVEALVYQQDASKIAEGQLLRYRPVGQEAYYTGKVHLVNRKFDEEHKTVNIHGHPDNDDSGLIPGAYLEVVIITKGDTVLSVPTDAVFEEADKYFVFVANADGSFEPFYLSTTNHNGLWYEVDSSLAGKNLVLQGGYYLKGKMNEDS